MAKFKVGQVDLEEDASYKDVGCDMGYADYYEELASTISDIKDAEAKAEKAKKKRKKNKKKSKKQIKEAERSCRRALAALESSEETRHNLEAMLKEEQLCHEYDCKVLKQQLVYERLLANSKIQAASREMNLIAAMQHPEICKKLVDQYIAVVRETIADNCMIEGDADEI